MPVRPTRGNDYTGMNCDDFLPVETPEDWDRYNECLRQNAMVGNNQEQKSSREAFKGGQWDPYVDQIPNPADKKIQWGDPLYTREQIEGAIPGLNLSGMPGIDSFSTPEQALAASMAGLQQLNDLEAQQKPLINPQDFAVNPYRGFFAQYGGYMSGDPQETMMTNSLLQIQDLTNNAILNTKSKKKKTDIAQAFMRVAEKLGVGMGNRTSLNFVGEKYQDGGMVEGDNIVPIQAEKGEMIIFPNGTTSPVKASKKHSQMSDEEVTDFIPQEPDGSSPYIASATPSVKLSKKEAADYVLNINDKPYVQNGKVKEPTLVTLADYFTNNKKMTPADLVKAADKKHKIQETREGEIQDPYTQQTNSFNLRFRQEQLFPNIIQAAEDKVQQVQTNELIDDLSFIASNADIESINPMMGMMGQQPTQLPQQFKYGGKVTGNKPGKYIPLLLPAIASTVTGILGGILSGNQAKKASEAQKRYAQQLRGKLTGVSDWAYETQKGYANQGALIEMISKIAALEAPERPSADPRNILAYQQLREQVPAELAAGQAMQRTATNVALANAAPILMSLPPEQRAGAMAQAVVGASSQAALAGLQQARATEREIAGKTSEMLRQDLMADYGAREKFRGERQATTLGIGQSIAKQQSTLANLAGQKAGREMAIASQYYGSLNAAEQARRQGNINAIGMGMSGLQSGIGMLGQGELAKMTQGAQGNQTPTYNALSQSPYLQPGATFQGAPAPQIGASTSYGGIGIDMNAYRNITGGAGTATGGPGINPSFFGLSSQPAFSGNAAAATYSGPPPTNYYNQGIGLSGTINPGYQIYQGAQYPDNFYQQFGGYINSGRESVFDKYTRLKKMEEGGYTSDPKAEKKKSKDVNYDSLIEYIKEAEGFTFQQGGFIPSSPLGQWKYPGQTVNVPSNNITMKGINHPNLGIGDNGVMKMMFPGKNYNFPGAKSVTEIPILPNKFQDGGPVKNPYEQGSELSRLWERFSEGYKPTSNVSIASGMSGVFIEDGQKYNRFLDLVADMGESSGRLESSLRELQQNQIRNKYGIVESRYSDPNSPTGNVFIESPDFNIYGNISGDNKEGILYPMTKITKEGKDIYTGMFKRPPVVDSNKRFKTKQEAEDYLVNTTKRLPFDANPRNFDIVDTGKNGFLVMESAAFSQLLDRTYRERSAQELAKVASLGYDPSTEDIKYGVGQENKNIVLKLSEELGKMFTGGKRYYDVRNGKLVEVTDQPGKERIKKGKTVETRSFAGTDPLLSLTLPKSKFGGFTNFDTKKKKV